MEMKPRCAQMADSFIKRKIVWLDQVLADSEVTAIAFQVAYLLVTKFMNAKTGTAWPAIATLAAHLHKSRRRIQEAITNLIERKHLEHRRGGTGKDRQGKPSTYRIVVFDKTETSYQSTDRQDENDLSMGGLIGRFPTTDRTKTARLIGRNRLTNPLIEPLEEPIDEFISQKSGSTSKPNAKLIEQQFNEFWQHYPRKASKGSARKAFGKALKKASFSDLIAGAMRYAAARDGQDSQYTKHASTWLTNECWLDEATKPDSRPKRQSLADIAFGRNRGGL